MNATVGRYHEKQHCLHCCCCWCCCCCCCNCSCVSKNMYLTGKSLPEHVTSFSWSQSVQLPSAAVPSRTDNSKDVANSSLQAQTTPRPSGYSRVGSSTLVKRVSRHNTFNKPTLRSLSYIDRSGHQWIHFMFNCDWLHLVLLHCWLVVLAVFLSVFDTGNKLLNKEKNWQ